MNRSDLVRKIAAKSDVTQREADSVLDAFEEVVLDAVKSGEKLTLSGFLTFEKITRSARTGRNPSTGAPLEIPERDAAKVSMGAKFKNLFKNA